MRRNLIIHTPPKILNEPAALAWIVTALNKLHRYSEKIANSETSESKRSRYQEKYREVKERLSEYLKKLPDETILIMSEFNDPENKLTDFLECAELKAHWQRRIALYSPASYIPRLTTPFKQFLGVIYSHDYKINRIKKDDGEALTEAQISLERSAELGNSFSQLRLQLQKISDLFWQLNNHEKGQTDIDSAIENMANITHEYGSIGHIILAVFYLKLAQYYSMHGAEETKTAQINACHQAALANTGFAWVLEARSGAIIHTALDGRPLKDFNRLLRTRGIGSFGQQTPFFEQNGWQATMLNIGMGQAMNISSAVLPALRTLQTVGTQIRTSAELLTNLAQATAFFQQFQTVDHHDSKAEAGSSATRSDKAESEALNLRVG